MKNLLSLATAFALLLTTNIHAQDDPKSKAVIDKLIAKSKAWTSFEADFASSLVNKASKLDVKQEGNVRVKGKLFMQRVTPRNGKPYILIDHQGDGTMTRHDNPLDSGVRVPQWVLLEF